MTGSALPSSVVFINLAEVKRRTTLSTTTIWRLVRKGAFPAPISLSPNRKAWSSAAVEKWEAAKLGVDPEKAA